MFTHKLCFLFLVYKAKAGQDKIEKADQQNLYSGSLAVRAIFRLFEAAFGKKNARVKGLDGKILVFIISHNNRIVNLYGYYIVINDEAEHGLDFFYYNIIFFSLIMYDGRKRFKTYNFVRNVYDNFAPEHFKKIRDVAVGLPAPASQTGLSFAASEMGFKEISSQDSDIFLKPNGSASASQKKESAKLREQMDKLLKQLEEQMQDSKKKEKKWEQQLEQQRKDSMQQLELQRKENQETQKRLERQVEQQRKDQTEKEEKMERRLQPGSPVVVIASRSAS